MLGNSIFVVVDIFIGAIAMPKTYKLTFRFMNIFPERLTEILQINLTKIRVY